MDYGFTALNVGKKCNFEIEQFRVPLDSISKGGIINNKGWVFVIDKVETSKALQEFIFNDNKNYEPDTSNFDSIIEQYFNDYDIKDDTTHPDYEYVPSINTNGNFEKPKNNSGNSSNNNKVEKPSSQGNSVNSSNKPSSGSTSTGNNSTEKPNTSEKPSIPQETPTEKPSENNGSSGNGESSNIQSNNGNTSSENNNNQNNTQGN